MKSGEQKRTQQLSEAGWMSSDCCIKFAWIAEAVTVYELEKERNPHGSKQTEP